MGVTYDAARCSIAHRTLEPLAERPEWFSLTRSSGSWMRYAYRAAALCRGVRIQPQNQVGKGRTRRAQLAGRSARRSAGPVRRRPGRDADRRIRTVTSRPGSASSSRGISTPRRSNSTAPSTCSSSRRTARGRNRESGSISIAWWTASAPTKSRRWPKATVSRKRNTRRRPSISCWRRQRPSGRRRRRLS